MRALVLFSGGLDSTVCLGMAVKEYGAGEVLALSIYYGQKHKKELEASEKIAAHYGVQRIVMNLDRIFEGSDCSLIESSHRQIPHGSYNEQLAGSTSPASTYVPYRNGLFLSVAASIALIHGCDVIYYGIHADDAAGCAYPDTGEAFNTSMAEAIYRGSGDRLRLIAPFVSETKAHVVGLGLELGVPFELTWSCYEGSDKPCGSCGTCIDRQRAFEANGVQDPLSDLFSV